MTPQQEYSGERFDPGQANALAHYDHHARYHFVRGAFGGRGQLLDLGCGLGIGSAFLAKDFERVVGIDPSLEAVRGARARHPAAHLEFHTIEDFERSRRDESFEVVTCLDVIEHTTEQAALVKLAKRRLAAKGVAVFSTPNIRFTREHGIVNPFHVRELTAEEFFGLLAAEFPHVQRWGMVQYNGAAVLPLQAHSAAVVGETVLSAPRGIDARVPEAATYDFVAMCSFEPLPAPKPLWLADVWCTYTGELQTIAADQARMIDERVALIRKQDEIVAELKQVIADRDVAVRELQERVALGGGGEGRPLRYRVVDRVNSALKQTPVHRIARRLLSAVTK